jgi:tRNA dimethylallyltransferase
VDETQKLIDAGLPKDHPNLSAIGYREVCEVLEKMLTIAEAKAAMRKKTREFVRRQRNWFKPDDPNIHWYEVSEDTLSEILRELRVGKLVE